MITVNLYDFDIGTPTTQLYICYQVNCIPVETHAISQLPIASVIAAKDFRIVIRDNNTIVGSISFRSDMIIPTLNAVRWVTLFDPSDDTYDGDFMQDDIEQPRILLRFQYGAVGITKSTSRKQPSISNNISTEYKELLKKYSILQEDIMKYREMTETELSELGKENEQLYKENEQLKQLRNDSKHESNKMVNSYYKNQ